LTRKGISYILNKYYILLLPKYNHLPKNISPHVLRNSKAMYLYQSSVNIIYIRVLLGHVDISTTDIYARADTETKRKALEATHQNITPSGLPDWTQDKPLMEFLNSLI
jgi:site-specific recombinase XerD